MYRSSYFELSEDRTLRVATLYRTPTPYASASAVRAEVDRLVGVFEARHRSWGVVCDFRDAPPRNDDAFESAMRHLRFAVGRAFGRVVVLVRTASGEMQVARLHREGGYAYHVTRDPDEARRLAASGDGHS